MNDMIPDALRQYERKRWLDAINAYGRAQAKELGLTEADVIPAVKKVRKERRARDTR